MNRRPPGPLPARPARRSEGLISRGSGRLPLLLAGGGLLLVIVLLVFFIASRCGTTANASGCNKKPPTPPSGFAYASCEYQISQNVGKQGSLTVPLTDRTSTRNLSLYTFDGGAWKRLGAVSVTSDGTAAALSQPISLPRTVAVLRRGGSDYQVFAVLPRGAPLSADAQRLESVLVPAVYTPGSDGSIAGGPVVVNPTPDLQTMPEIVAEASGADSQAVGAILADSNRSQTHVDRIASEADRGGWSGVEIDYTTVDPSLKANFSTFVAALSTRLHASKRKLVLRMPLPRHEGSNWNVGAYDWATLAKSADYLVMVAEHDQSIYRTRVPDAVKYLVSALGDARKLVLEVTPLAEQKSETGEVSVLTSLQALSIAGQITVRDPDNAFVDSDISVSADNIHHDTGSGLQWTPQGVLSFSYKAGEEQRTVWVENQYSAAYKLEIAQLYHLGGIEVDDASGDPSISNIWPAIDQFTASNEPTLQQPNPQSLRPQWLADGLPIPDAGNQAVITWHTPTTTGPHLLNVIVSDGVMRVADSATVEIKPVPPGGRPTPTAGAAPARITPTPIRSAVPTRAATSPAR